MAYIMPKGKNPRKPYTVRYQVDGRTRERSFRTQGEAKDFIIKYEHDSRESVFLDPRNGSIPFGEYARTWIESRPTSAQTKRGYHSVLKHAEPLLARKLRDVAQDREGVGALLADCSRAANLRLVIVGCLNEAKRAGRITDHRCSGLKIAATSRRADFHFATKAELDVLAHGIGERFRLTVWLQRGCGLRAGEALAVRKDCFRDGGTVLRLTEQILPDGTVGPLKSRKPGDYRDVPVPAYVWQIVKDLPGGYLFDRAGKHAVRTTFATAFTKARIAAKLPDGFTSHTLRHCYVSACLSSLIPISDVAKWIGHADINLTYATYGHLVPSSFTRAREILGAEWD